MMRGLVGILQEFDAPHDSPCRMAHDDVLIIAGSSPPSSAIDDRGPCAVPNSGSIRMIPWLVFTATRCSFWWSACRGCRNPGRLRRTSSLSAKSQPGHDRHPSPAPPGGPPARLDRPGRVSRVDIGPIVAGHAKARGTAVIRIQKRPGAGFVALSVSWLARCSGQVGIDRKGSSHGGFITSC